MRKVCLGVHHHRSPVSLTAAVLCPLHLVSPPSKLDSSSLCNLPRHILLPAFSLPFRSTQMPRHNRPELCDHGNTSTRACHRKRAAHSSASSSKSTTHQQTRATKKYKQRPHAIRNSKRRNKRNNRRKTTRLQTQFPLH